MWCAARAEPPSDAKEQATRLRDEGVAALQRHDPALALERFEAAYRAFPSPRLGYNVALALDALGRVAGALDAFERFLAEAADAPPAHRAWAERRVRELGARCGRLVLAIDPPGARLSLDGAPVPAGSPSSLRVAAGPHEIAVEKAGFATARRAVTAVAGEATAVAIRLEPIAAPPRPSPLVVAEVAPRASPAAKLARRWWLWALVATVTVGVGTAAAVASTASSAPHHADNTLGVVTPHF
jgi:hypothetical protein